MGTITSILSNPPSGPLVIVGAEVLLIANTATHIPIQGAGTSSIAAASCVNAAVQMLLHVNLREAAAEIHRCRPADSTWWGCYHALFSCCRLF